MPAIDRWIKYLDRMQIHYSHSTHPWSRTALETASAENVPPRELAKIVVYWAENGFGFAVVTADQFVDLPKVARLLGLSKIRLATKVELARLFPNCEIGAMPPFGNEFEFPVIVDASVTGDYIALPLVTHRDVVRMRFGDFQRLAKPVIGVIATGHHAFANA
jgi:Ala-tRNA(Pro) deacylase